MGHYSFVASNPRELPPSADPLGETLHLLRLTGTLYCRSELSAPWGIDLPAFPGCMMFHIIMSGRAVLEVEGAEPIELEQGSIALVPHGKGHSARSAPDVHAEPLFDIPVDQVSERYEVMHYGGGGKRTHLLCGLVRFDHVAAAHLIELLPAVIHVDAFDDEDDAWLQSTLRFISREARALRPGGETVLTRLADVLVIQLIRSWIDSTADTEQGWLAALRDSQVGAALTSIHREPARDWTVAALAKQAGMSRSAFSARFSQMVGRTAMRYLTHWRMQLARTELRETSEPLSVLAGRVGYESEAAFCRAFKRTFGVSPGSVRREASVRASSGTA